MSTHNICFCEEVRKIFEPAPNKTYNKTCATSKDSDQPVHPCSLIRVFTDCMCLLQPPGYQRGINESPYHVDVQADLSLCWSHRSYCVVCRLIDRCENRDSLLIWLWIFTYGSVFD